MSRDALRTILPGVGETLRSERDLRGISLEEVAQTTRIPLRTLKQMEAERWQDLPGDVFARGFLRSYAQAIGLDARPLLARYEISDASETKVAMPTIAPQERGRRFGIAIALVVLLVLFTLALSIVLRPRRRDVPVELSQTIQVQPGVQHGRLA
ncbi:MAG: cytoskeletal protein RodZ [Polyangiales bacterium]